MTEQLGPQALLQDRRTAWGLVFFATVLILAGNLPWQLDDYDQAKQAFTSFQMVNGARWLYQTTPHDWVATKPPLVGWISAAIFLVTRWWDLAWRLPSLLAALTIAFLLFRFSKSAFGNAAAVIAFAAFAFNLMTPRLSTLVRTDMPLAFVIFAVGLLIWNRIREKDPWQPNDRLIIFCLLTAGMLIKGPVVLAFLLPGIVAFQFWRGQTSVSSFAGVWPWVASTAIFLVWAAGGIWFVPGFYDQVVVREFLGRFGGEAHRAQPLLFYFPHLLHKFAPWSVLMIGLGILQLRAANWRARNLRMSTETCWLVCWILGGFITMSLLPSKRVDRIFPVIPPLCLLLATQISAARPTPSLETRFYRWSAAAIVLALLFSGGYVLWRASTGYRQHRDALAKFGKAVREQASVHGWRYGVVASPDEGMLLYLRKTRFVLPQRAIADWNAGELDALTVSSADEPDVISQLNPKGIYVLRTLHRPDSDALDYVLITKAKP